MLSVIEAIVGVVRGIGAAIEFLLNVVDSFEALYHTGCGLRWLCSAEYRRRLRDEENASLRCKRKIAIAFGLFVITITLVLIATILFR